MHMDSNSNATVDKYDDFTMASFETLKAMMTQAQTKDNSGTPAKSEAKPEAKPEESKTLIIPTDIKFTVGMLEQFPDSIVSMLRLLGVIGMYNESKTMGEDVTLAQAELDRQTRKLDKQKSDSDYTQEDVDRQAKEVTKAKTNLDRLVKEQSKTTDSLRQAVASLPELLEQSKTAPKEFKKMAEQIAPLYETLKTKTEQPKEDE